MEEGSEQPTISQMPSEVPTDGQRPKRARRTKEQMDAARREERREELADRPPFDPEVLIDVGYNLGHLSATAKRVVRTGPYESFELLIHADLPRDPRFGVFENIDKVAALVTDRVNTLADQVQKAIGTDK